MESDPWPPPHTNAIPAMLASSVNAGLALRPACLGVRRRGPRHCFSPRAEQAPEEADDEDVERVMTRPGSKSSVRLFGVAHLSASSRCADFILEAKPPVVVVETAVDDDHGSCCGNAVSAQLLAPMESDAMRGLRGICQMLFREAESSDAADWVRPRRRRTFPRTLPPPALLRPPTPARTGTSL